MGVSVDEAGREDFVGGIDDFGVWGWGRDGGSDGSDAVVGDEEGVVVEGFEGGAGGVEGDEGSVLEELVLRHCRGVLDVREMLKE